ncbi:MAG: hypothetical protein K1X67_17425 [Fimbriimonadaceae bacterium]|nr:hypothetical protein [Fimbriimonadaceae bacterium]
MKTLIRAGLLSVIGFSLVSCGEQKGEDLSKVGEQPAADLERGKNAQSIDEWAKANPNNGAPGSGEGGGK